MNSQLKILAKEVIRRFDKLDIAIDVNDEPACTLTRELCHAIDDLWAHIARNDSAHWH